MRSSMKPGMCIRDMTHEGCPAAKPSNSHVAMYEKSSRTKRKELKDEEKVVGETITRKKKKLTKCAIRDAVSKRVGNCSFEMYELADSCSRLPFER